MFLTQGGPERGRLTPFRYGTAGTTTVTTLASQGGLLINIDSATGDIAQTASGWIEDEKFGFNAREFATSTSAEFDTAVTRTGTKTLKLSTLDATGRIRCFPAPQSNYSTAATNLTYSHYYIPCKGSTKYRYSIWIQTNNVAASSTFFRLTQMNSAGTSVATTTTSLISGDTPMTLYTGDFTTVASSIFIGWEMSTDVAGNIGDAWFDVNSMTLEEVVEPVANSLNNVSPSIQSFTAAGSTDNIDQSQLSTTNTLSFSTVAQYQAQQIITTKSKFTGVTLYKKASVGSPTGTMTFSIVNDNAAAPGTTVYATSTMSNATYIALADNAEFTVNLPCNIPAGTYWLKISYSVSSATDYPVIGALNGAGSYTGLYKYGIDGVTYGVTFAGDAYFKTLYYKPTTNFKASQNNTSISISADEDGFQYNSILNLTTGAYSFATPYSGTTGTTALLNQILCNQQSNLMTQSSSTDINWRFANTVVFKVKIPLYATGRTANLIFGTLYNSTGQTITYSYSYDNVTYYTASTVVTAGGIVDNRANGVSIPITNNSPDGTLYIAYNNSGGDNRLYWVGMNTTIDTSTIPTLYNYPTNKDVTKYYTTTLGSPTTSATYRATKWGFPAIEYSATEYQFLNIDTTATGGVVQFSELGSVFTTVADGASLAITSTSTPLLWVRTNITANRLFISSNDYNASSDKDGSMKQSLVYQVIQ